MHWHGSLLLRSDRVHSGNECQSRRHAVSFNLLLASHLEFPADQNIEVFDSFSSARRALFSSLSRPAPRRLKNFAAKRRKNERKKFRFVKFYIVSHGPCRMRFSLRRAERVTEIALVADREGSLAYHIINANSHTQKLETLIIKTTNCTSAKREKSGESKCDQERGRAGIVFAL